MHTAKASLGEGDPMVLPHPRYVIQYVRSSYCYNNIVTVNCPVSNHFYFKADSKYLLRGNKISA